MRAAWLVVFLGASLSAAAATPSPAPVDTLIPWLLQEDTQLRGLPFAEVIKDATGKRVLAIDPQNPDAHKLP